ncbi:MAG: hypothetical protein RMY29_006345 [Nostoc sp. CreGUA01]|nr:hypothetical protein [Nostoc sp. CreGUA01]
MQTYKLGEFMGTGANNNSTLDDNQQSTYQCPCPTSSSSLT